MQNILVPIDFSDLTEREVVAAAQFGKAFGSTVRLLHVAPPDPSFASSNLWPQEVRDEFAKELQNEHRELDALVKRLEDEGVHVKGMMGRGPVADTILEYAKKTETDLIILGAHHKGAFAELLPNSVIKTIMRQSACPLYVIPEPLPEEGDGTDA